MNLFAPLRLRSLDLTNRVVVSPMCQYSARDGQANDWHLMHVGSLAVSGFGLLVIEATAIEPRGRITLGCLGLYDDACEAALARVVGFCKAYGHGAVGLQLAHAGRKGSMHVPWEGRSPLASDAGGWATIAPSTVPHAPGIPPPVAMTEGDLEDVRNRFVAAARRAERIGIDLLELHFAHGYLLHQFLSPLANGRDDAYGGSRTNRMRYPLSVFAAVRDAWPVSRPLGVRISATDHAEGGWDLDDSVELIAQLNALGCDFIDVSSGGLSAQQKITVGPGYQLPQLDYLKQASDLPMIAVGLIDDPRRADQIVRAGRAELIALGRGALDDPRWVWHAARTLGERVDYPPQYLRSAPDYWQRESRDP